MNLKSFNAGVIQFARPALITLKTALVGAAGAALTGGAIAARQYVAANGANQDWQSVGSAAAAGAVVAAGAYFLQPPQK